MNTHDSSLDRTLHAIADSTRRRILEVLKHGDAHAVQRRRSGQGSAIRDPHEKCDGLCAGDIEARVKLSQPTISHHMAVLTKAGLVEAVKQGQWRWYRRNEKAIRQLIKGLRSKI